MNYANPSRRRLLRASAGAALGWGLWPGAMAAQNVEMEEISFLCANDLHYIDEKDEAFFALMARKMKGARTSTGHLLTLGDLVEKAEPKPVSRIAEILRSTGLSVKTVIGNHDWLKDDDRKAHDQAWPGMGNYLFEMGRWIFMGVDSTMGTKYEKTRISDDAIGWVEETLRKLDKKRPIVVMTHFPLGERVTYRPGNAEKFLERFKEHNLRGALSGHFHGLTRKSHGEASLTTGKCCANQRTNHDKTNDKGFYVVSGKEGKLTMEFVKVAEGDKLAE